MLKSIYKFFHKNYLRRYHGQYAHAKKLFVIDIFLFAVTLVMFGTTLFFLFWNPGLTDQIDLKISLGDGRIKSGEFVKITVDYTNRSKFSLHDSILALHLPAGFVLDRNLTPTTFRDDNTVNLQNLNPGANGQVTIAGRLWFEPKQDYKIIILLSYLPENSKTREQKIGATVVNLPDSVLQASLVVSTTTVSNSPIPFTYTIKNNGDIKLEKIHFNLDHTFCKYENGQDTSLDKDEEKTITGQICPPPVTSEYHPTIIVSTNINNQSLSLLKTGATIKNFSPQAYIAAAITDVNTYGEPNKIINAALKWQNYGDLELANQSIRVTFTPGIVDIKTTAKENGFEIDGKDLMITAKARTALANGTPKTSDEFPFKIYLLPTFSVSDGGSILEVMPIFEAELKSVPGQKFKVSGAVVARLQLATELSVAAEARYYSDDGDQLGRGPLPPQAGETTKYWIFVRVNNTTNDVRDAVFSAKLPDNIKFTGKQSVSIGPSITYNETTGILNWNFYALPANSQTGLYFEVAVTPTPNQIGKNINLLSDLKFTASDKITGKQFNLITNNITNHLPATDLGSQR